MGNDELPVDDHDSHAAPTGIKRVGYTRPTTRILEPFTYGLVLIMFFTGGAMAMIIRAELFQPGLQLVEPRLSLTK